MLSCGGKNGEIQSCCGKVIFSIATDDGRTTKITSCDIGQSAEFCFQINNPRVVYLDECAIPPERTVYVADYGDGITEVIEPSSFFCHTFPEGGHMIRVTSYAYSDGCYPVSYTKSYQIGVVPCSTPEIESVVNSCCITSPCEVVVGTCCNIGINAKDPLNQPLTYCWDRDGDGEYEYCDSFHITTVCFRDIGRKIIGTMVENACGCERESEKLTVDVLASVTNITQGNISVSLNAGDIYPQVMSDTLYLYISSTVTTPKHPVLLVYSAPVTSPFNLSLGQVIHGEGRGYDISFSDNGYLHMNGRAEGVYVYEATYPLFIREVSKPDPSTRQGGWIEINNTSIYPNKIYAEGVTGLALENPMVLLVNLRVPPKEWKEQDRYYPDNPLITNSCPNVSDIFMLYPFVFVGRLMNSNPLCGVELHDYSNGYFGSSYYENPYALEVLRYTGCSDSSICELIDIKGKHGFVYENDYLGPATYSSPVTLTLFTRNDYYHIDVHASDGVSTVQLVDGVDYTLTDIKHIQISQSFYSSHVGYVYSATYTVPDVLVGGIKGPPTKVLFWDVGNYPEIITGEKLPSAPPVSVDAFSDGIVVSCGEPQSGLPLQKVLLDVFDFTDPFNPLKISTLDLANNTKCKLHPCRNIKAFKVNGNRIVGVDTDFEVSFINLNNLSTPRCEKTVYLYGTLTDIHAYLSDYLLFTMEMGGMMVYNISDYKSPYFVSAFQNGRIFEGLEVVNDKVFAITNEFSDDRLDKRSGRLDVIDISNLLYPYAITSIELSNSWNSALNCIEEGERRVYIAGENYTGMVDVSDPFNPYEVGWDELTYDSQIYSAKDCSYSAGTFVVLTESGKIFIYSTSPSFLRLNVFTPMYTGGFISSVYLTNGVLYIGSRGRITIYDINDPLSPLLLSIVEIGNSYYQVNHMDLVNNFLFAGVEDTSTGVYDLGYGYIYDVTDPSSPLKYSKFGGYAFNRVIARQSGAYYNIYLSAPKQNILMFYRAILSY